MKCKVRLIHLNSVREFQINLNSQLSVLEQLKNNQIPIAHSCGGFGTCGTCQILISSGFQYFLPPDELEQEWQIEREHPINQRLSCQSILKDAINQDQSNDPWESEELIIQIIDSNKSY